jgi:hypothetical protein
MSRPTARPFITDGHREQRVRVVDGNSPPSQRSDIGTSTTGQDRLGQSRELDGLRVLESSVGL